jgi:hypothetical protein
MAFKAVSGDFVKPTLDSFLKSRISLVVLAILLNQFLSVFNYCYASVFNGL